MFTIELKSDGTYAFNYGMGNFRVNRDISTHSDFVSASVEGSKTDNLYSGVNLEFEHKLCKIDFKAWGKNPSYDVEIAGVRIGGVMVKSTYNLAGNWISHAADWDCVEYIFRGGDKVVRIGSGSHDSEKDAASIMGNGGYALMIPHRPSNLTASLPAKWDYVKNPTNSTKQGMYFSVLLRVTDKVDFPGLLLYPYIEGTTMTSGITEDKMNVVYLVVEKATGKVKTRVYKNRTTGAYYTDSAKTIPYSVEPNDEVRNYGWAAVPYRAEWYINNQYTYTLDYSKGVGVEDPADACPGKPILYPIQADVTENRAQWHTVKDYEGEEIEADKIITYE